MAPLSNAERQARHRERIKERASFDALGARSREAVDRAIDALWSFYSRPDDEGRVDAFLDGCETVADLRAELATRSDALISSCRETLTFSDELTAEEAKALTVIVEVADAIELAAERPKKKGRKP